VQFLGFLRNCSKAYWDLGSGLGKVNQAVYCRHLLTGRSDLANLPWPSKQSDDTAPGRDTRTGKEGDRRRRLGLSCRRPANYEPGRRTFAAPQRF
jgi:hypothetical protein